MEHRLHDDDKHDAQPGGQAGRGCFRVVSEEPPNSVRAMLPDAPLTADGLVVPDGFMLKPGSTARLKSYGSGTSVTTVPQAIASAPILIVGRLRDVETGDEFLRIAWRRDGRHERVESRAALMNANDLVKLAGKGFPVTSGSSGEVSRYLDAFEHANLEQLAVEHVSRHLGWQGEQGKYGFLWGHTHLAPEATDGAEAPVVTFRGQSNGDEQIARGFRSQGTIEGWLAGVAPLAQYPKALLGFYAAFVPPLLDLLDCPNFIVDWGSRTSTGKTTVLRVAASVAGNPNEDAPDSVVGTWDTTRVAVERRCGLLTGLPVLLDDTKKAKKTADVGDILYGVASGQGRGRGNLDGQERTQTWRTVLLSTGEAPAVSFTTAGGVRGRVLTIRGLPFESDNAHALVQRLNVAVMSHYGHALPLFLHAVMERRERWSEWRAGYQREKDRLMTDASNNVAFRLATYFAAVTQAAKLVHRVFEEAGHPLPWRYTRQLDALWRTLAAETDDASVDIRALQDAVSWAYANQARFYRRVFTYGDSDRQPEPPGGWLGRWPEDGKYIAFFPHHLKKFLEERDYRSEEVLAGWRERGWIELDKEGKHKQVRWPFAGKVRMVALRREALDSVTGSGDDCLGDVEPEKAG